MFNLANYYYWISYCFVSTIFGFILVKDVLKENFLKFTISSLIWFSLSPIQFLGICYNNISQVFRFRQLGLKTTNWWMIPYFIVAFGVFGFFVENNILLYILVITFYVLRLGSFFSFLMRLKFMPLLSILLNLFLVYKVFI